MSSPASVSCILVGCHSTYMHIGGSTSYRLRNLRRLLLEQSMAILRSSELPKQLLVKEDVVHGYTNIETCI